VCGYVVDFVRSCYEGEWRLFADHPELKTKGRYVFAPDDTRHYPFPHNFGSRNWVTDERDPLPLLGDVTEGRAAYSNGQPEGPIPGAAYLGTPDCIRYGESWPLPVIERDLTTGFDSRCPQRPLVAVVQPRPFPDVRRCRDQQALAYVLNTTYTDGVFGQTKATNDRFPSLGIHVVLNSYLPTPGTIIATQAGTGIVWISGTTNLLQWTNQILSGLVPLTNQGAYSTLFAWELAALDIANRMALAGILGGQPLLLCGHSLGGAIAQVLAAKIRYAFPNANIQLLTFGSPKGGDERLQTILRSVTQLHLVNDNDPVPYLPPSSSEIVPFVFLIPPTLYNQYLLWGTLFNRVGLRPNGERIDNPPIESIYLLVFRYLASVYLGFPLPIMEAHTMVEYLRRIICPADPAPGPVPPEETGGLTFNGEAVLSSRGPLLGEGGVTLNGEAVLSSRGPLLGEGGVTLNGEAVLSSRGPLLGEGGVTLNGEAVLSSRGPLLGEGGVTLNGEAEIGNTVAITGEVILWSSPAGPIGFLPCDGAAVSRAVYASLFSVIGTTWGIGDGVTTFNLPDLRSRIPIGQGVGPGLSIRLLADMGGAERTNVTTTNLATHHHFMRWDISHVDLNPGSTDTVIKDFVAGGTVGGDTFDEGAGNPVEVMNPFTCLGFYIKT
jgi:hypothetical protein